MSFETINYLLFEKRKELDGELLNSFNPYMTAKTLSFYNDGKMANYVNDYLNCYSNIFSTKEDQFKFYENIIPIQKRKRITYIKKPKTEKIEEIPVPEFYSRREIDLFEDMNKYEHE
jgi:hypothetical protein